MFLLNSTALRTFLVVLSSVLLVSGCVRSSNSDSDDVPLSTDTSAIDGDSANGSSPQIGDALEPVQANLELVVDKTIRISWQLSTGAQYYRVLENPDGISGFSDISMELDATTTHYDHRVAL